MQAGFLQTLGVCDKLLGLQTLRGSGALRWLLRSAHCSRSVPRERGGVCPTPRRAGVVALQVSQGRAGRLGSWQERPEFSELCCETWGLPGGGEDPGRRCWRHGRHT